MVLKRVTRLTILTLLVVVLVSSTLPNGASVRAQANLRVIASFSILTDVAQQVAGDTIEVDSLMSTGQDPHSFQPTPKDVVALSEADAVLIVGINFEENLMSVLDEAVGDRLVVVSECVPVRPFGDMEHHHNETDHDPEALNETDIADRCAAHHIRLGEVFTTTPDYDQQHNHHDQDVVIGMVYEGVCGTDEHGQGEHDHDAGSCDPHVWMDPVNVALWTLMIRDTFSALDPGHADLYAANADAYLRQLAALDHKIHELLAPIPEAKRTIVTNHQAFNYLAAPYGLHVVGTVIPGGSTGAEPSTRDVVRLIETIQNFGVPAIFTETTVSENLAEQIAAETGAIVVRLYTGSLSEPDEPASTYLDYMRFNASQIASALH